MKDERAPPRILTAVLARLVFARGRVVLYLFLTVLGFYTCAYAEHTWRVVILPGADPTQPAAQEQIRAIRHSVAAMAPDGVEFYTDSLDDLRFDNAELMNSFLVLLKRKYEHKQVDIVIGLADFALDFTKRYHDEIWPGVPVVISSVAAGRQKDIPADFAYVPTYLDVNGTLALAEILQPRARRLVIVSGLAKLDLRSEQIAVATARARTSRQWTVDVWSGLTVSELQQRLAALDSTAAVLYTTMYRDRTGRTFFPYEVVAPMAKVSGAPIYGWYPTYLGHGLAAGSVVNFDANGRTTGALAASILLGEAPRQGAVSSANPSHCIADVGVIEKLGLDTRGLPADCELVNVPPSLWREYRIMVLGAVAIVLLQALTIAALLWQRQRRRIAEDEATLRSNELARAARFASAGELSASVAHEIGQPLGAILSNADAAGLMLRNEPEDELHAILADIRRDALRANQVVQRLRALLQKRTFEYVPLDLNGAFDEGLALLNLEARRRRIAVESNFAAQNACVLGDRVQLQQVLINLVINAMDAMEETPLGERIVSISTQLAGKGYQLIVADSGHGFPADAGERMFDSLYTTKPHGMGLGLSIVRTIVSTHGGQVRGASRDGGGSVFTVWLPASERPVLSPTPTGRNPSTESAGLTAPPMPQGGHP
ncbi:sensor histidine kinase [Paraburkholderia phytofirmans]|uniref:histidine kinase n=1 Tax=Paraburkholderia phytofirmans (strain DSM 17436 / LMG 22146 / PsJN) TaxID=398527 RepID=B2T975_PARPJ|nr:ATP-binding protein [Paraburkholderia phytofirmans]ACD20977.1 integral membrane sensor signal transduction histidine kinase [Paraburkholderia phytofirmans PsJN]